MSNTATIEVNNQPLAVAQQVPLKIYISGKITGIEEQAEEIFNQAEAQLRLSGLNPVNPYKLPHQHDKSWHAYMKEDVQALCGCDAIYMLSNWTDSKGAIIEHSIAVLLGLRVYFQSSPDFII